MIKPNKERKAQIVVCALWNMADYPPVTDTRVRRRARLSLPALDAQYEQARKVLMQR